MRQQRVRLGHFSGLAISNMTLQDRIQDTVGEVDRKFPVTPVVDLLNNKSLLTLRIAGLRRYIDGRVTAIYGSTAMIFI